MQPFRDERTLVWAAFDELGSCAALTNALLTKKLAGTGIDHRCRKAQSPQEMYALPEEPLGLALWRVGDSAQMPEICTAIGRMRDQQPAALIIVYCDVALEPWSPILLEAGAQAVIWQVPSLQRLLDHVLHMLVDGPDVPLPLSSRGSNPLTSDLGQELPWPE